MLRRVCFHGPLRRIAADVEIAGDTVFEIMEAVSRQLPGFRPDPVRGMKQVRVVGFDTEAKLKSPLGPDVTEIHVVPPIAFAKDAGLTQVVVGVLLIGIAIAMGGTFWPVVVASLGASLVAGGVMQMLAPQPNLQLGEEQERSRSLGAPQNTVEIGTPIPIGYGTFLCQGHFLSLDIDAVEVVS